MADTAVVLVDCFSVVHMHLPLATPDACVAARAAIRAAEIQAEATRSAGMDTLYAGVIALIGGLSTVVAIWFDIKKRKHAEAFKFKAYINKVSALFLLSNKEIECINKFTSNDIEKIQADNSTLSTSILEMSFPYPNTLRDTLTLQNWSAIYTEANDALDRLAQADIYLNKIFDGYNERRELASRVDDAIFSNMTARSMNARMVMLNNKILPVSLATQESLIAFEESMRALILIKNGYRQRRGTFVKKIFRHLRFSKSKPPPPA